MEGPSYSPHKNQMKLVELYRSDKKFFLGTGLPVSLDPIWVEGTANFLFFLSIFILIIGQSSNKIMTKK